MDPLTAEMYEMIVESVMNGLISVSGMGLLVYYSIHRKFKTEKPKNLWERIDRWRVEIIIAGVLIPQWADWLPHLLNGLD